MERWAGKVAVVTGASAGIGLATAKDLVRNGLTVVGLARRIDLMNEEMENIEGPGKFYAKQCDVTIEQDVIEAFDWIKETVPSVNILVNNAGVLRFNKIEDCPTEELETVFKVNVFGLLYCTKQAIKLMKENETEGHIININSTAGHQVPLFSASINVYSASKFAVTALSETLKNELTDSKIRVTSISLGVVKTYMVEAFADYLQITDGIPALDVEDVSNSILYALGVPSHVEINEITMTMKIL